MPYADKEKQAAYNRAWWREHSHRYIDSPLSVEIQNCVREFGPIGPTEIVERIGRSNRNVVQVQLQRLKKLGRVKHLGYGRWSSA